MNKLGLGFAILPFLAGGALAGQPLTNTQMDKVTAGFDLRVEEQSDFSTVLLAINHTPASCAGLCYINAAAGFISVQSAFGNVSSLLPT